MTPADRRSFLAAAGLAAASTAGLSACSNKPKVGLESRGPVTIPSSDVPVGAGVVLKDKGFVVTQPTKGRFCAFSNICPHAGCSVTAVTETDIFCGCHGSKFKLDDGSVLKGPATSGLGPAKVKVDGDQLTISN